VIKIHHEDCFAALAMTKNSKFITQYPCAFQGKNGAKSAWNVRGLIYLMPLAASLAK
jgi:hypothetical protein